MNYAAVVAALESLRNAVDDLHSAVESMAAPNDQNLASASEQLAVFDEALEQIKSYGPDA